MKLTLLILSGILAACPVLAAAEPATTEEIKACIRRNVPEVTSLQAVEFSSRDRLGEEGKTRVSIASRRTSDGFRRVLAQVTAPEDVAGTSFLVSEGPDGISMSVYLPEFEAPKSITGGEASGNLFGTDFSYEDFERLQGMNWEAEAEELIRLPDGSAEERDAFVLESRPEDSSYERILAYFDKETCIALRTEFYENPRRPRKVLIADPAEVRQVDGAWVAHSLLMMDMRDQTQTRLVVESVNTGLELPPFDPMQPIPVPKPTAEPPKPEFDQLDVETELR